MRKRTITLNCDMGESFGNWKMGDDEAVMPWVDMANIACGFHASDPDVMAKTIALAQTHNVRIGAHPGYQDLSGFGRRSIPHTAEQLAHLVSYQVGALQALASLYKAKVEYIKPHGALYNDMMSNPMILESMIKTAAKLKLPLMLLARINNQIEQALAEKYQAELLFEAFADRAYTDDGALMPRQQPNAVLHDPSAIQTQVLQLANHGTITTPSGKTLHLQADTVCVHGDNPDSIAMVKHLAKALKE